MLCAISVTFLYTENYSKMNIFFKKKKKAHSVGILRLLPRQVLPRAVPSSLAHEHQTR